MRHFNPRPREEGDQVKTNCQVKDFISIHALVKRATIRKMGTKQYANISIHALVKRATIVLLISKR